MLVCVCISLSLSLYLSICIYIYIHARRGAAAQDAEGGTKEGRLPQGISGISLAEPAKRDEPGIRLRCSTARSSDAAREGSWLILTDLHGSRFLEKASREVVPSDTAPSRASEIWRAPSPWRDVPGDTVRPTPCATTPSALSR